MRDVLLWHCEYVRLAIYIGIWMVRFYMKVAMFNLLLYYGELVNICLYVISHKILYETRGKKIISSLHC